MSADQFVSACRARDETEMKSLYQQDPRVINQLDSDGWTTGLMFSLCYKHHSLSRWLLSLAGLDTGICNGVNMTALHWACNVDTPLDIVITLTRRSSWQTVNMQRSSSDKRTALDYAVQFKNTSAALYLSWLGAECKDENRKYREVNLQTWIETGCQLGAQYWTVAANDIKALKVLRKTENVSLDREGLKGLAKLFNRHKICSVWGSPPSSLASLAWEELENSSPTVASLRPATLLELTPPDLHYIVRLLCRYRQDLTEDERRLLGLTGSRQ